MILCQSERSRADVGSASHSQSLAVESANQEFTTILVNEKHTSQIDPRTYPVLESRSGEGPLPPLLEEGEHFAVETVKRFVRRGIECAMPDHQ